MEAPLAPGVDAGQIGSVGPETDWSAALEGVGAVVHLAGRAHRLDEDENPAASAHEQVNAEGTRRLAECAAANGVRRFVFLSTVKVNGERTFEKPFVEDDPPAPNGAYAVSKWRAEQALQEIGKRRGLDFVIIRPPLVYGPGVRANFLMLLRLVDRGVPLPLGGIVNKRSLVGLGNLIEMILACLRHDKAAGQTFLVSDREDVSTPDLVRKIAHRLGRPCRLVFAPRFLLDFAGRVTGKSDSVKRLVESLQVDISKAKMLLGWRPTFSMDQGLDDAAKWFRATNPKK
jgi:nucleoside-diphosphate-sugar epimerase